MYSPRFRIRTLMIAVAVVGTFLALAQQHPDVLCGLLGLAFMLMPLLWASLHCAKHGGNPDRPLIFVDYLAYAILTIQVVMGLLLLLLMAISFIADRIR